MGKLYLVQHGEAKPKTEDAERPLTERGDLAVRRVATYVARAGVEVAEIRHSAKLRARQTAAIFEEHLRPQLGAAAVEGLGPKDDVKPLAHALSNGTGTVMCVGHLPFLTRLAGRLVAGNPDRNVVRFRMGGVVCLERDDRGHWAVAWAVTPDIVPE